MQPVHFQVQVDVFNCQQILATISFVIFDIVIKKIQIEWHGSGIRNPANGIQNPTIVIQNPLGCWNPVCCDGSRASSFPLATVACKSHVARTRNKHVHACSLAGAFLVISGINLKQWSRRDRIPGSDSYYC